MHHFDYKDGQLFCEDVSLQKLAEDVGTPLYIYSSKTLTRHYKVLETAFADFDHQICYAVKANSNLAVLKLLANLGAGMDVVSGGELTRALKVGVKGEKICFSGVGKTKEEIRAALKAGIFCFNVESAPELMAINEIALEEGLKAPVALRVNPDVDAKTHKKISTGKAENKFGIPFNKAPALYKKMSDMDGLEVKGIHMHIGSQITDLTPFENAFTLLAALVAELKSDGINITHVDVGGGLGIPYSKDDTDLPHPDDYAKIVANTIGSLGMKIIFEPGRLIAGNAGALLSKVLYVKKGEKKNFLIIDAAMNDLVRPTLYEAHHDIEPVEQARLNQPTQIYDVVGPVCETGDFLAQDRNLPHLEPQDLIVIMSAGAYGATLSSVYNSRALIPEVLVDGAQYAIIRRRFKVEDMLALEQIPDWLS